MILAVWPIYHDPCSITHVLWSLQYDPCIIIFAVWSMYCDPCSMANVLWSLQYDSCTLILAIWSMYYDPRCIMHVLWSLQYDPCTMFPVHIFCRKDHVVIIMSNQFMSLFHQNSELGFATKRLCVHDLYHFTIVTRLQMTILTLSTFCESVIGEFSDL